MPLMWLDTSVNLAINILMFTGLGWEYTLVSENYRTRIPHLYGVFGLVVPGIGISWLLLLQ